MRHILGVTDEERQQRRLGLGPRAGGHQAGTLLATSRFHACSALWFLINSLPPCGMCCSWLRHAPCVLQQQPP